MCLAKTPLIFRRAGLCLQNPPMEVLLLTTLFSVVFAVLFLMLFIRERQVQRFGGAERDALLPFDDGQEVKKDQTVACQESVTTDKEAH